MNIIKEMLKNVFTEGEAFIKNLNITRQLINEGGSRDTIVDAINGHKYLYIYYSGDNTVMKGYRIIMPFVIGTFDSGEVVLRAWETEGNSDTFYRKGVDKRRRLDHEYFVDNGKEIPGWRLFKVDKITKIYPTGKKFNKIPPKYNPNDKQMSTIIASISDRKPDVNVDVEKNVISYKRKDIVKSEVLDLYNIVTKVKKKSPDNYTVITDDDGFKLVDNKNVGKYSDDDIVGNLRDLYVKIALPYLPIKSSGFHNLVKKRIMDDLKNDA